MSPKLEFKVCSRSYSSKVVTTYGSMKRAVVHVTVWKSMPFFPGFVAVVFVKCVPYVFGC